MRGREIKGGHGLRLRLRLRVHPGTSSLNRRRSTHLTAQ